MANITLSTKVDPVDHCDGLCINPDTIKLDALRLMTYSNSREALKGRSEHCPTTQGFDKYVFGEVLNLFVSLALRCRLWKENYYRGDEQAEIDNITVGIRRTGKRRGKPVKISEVLSFVSHAKEFWFDPCVLEGYKTGVNISIDVPTDKNRGASLQQSISMVVDAIEDDDKLTCTEKSQCLGAIKNLPITGDLSEPISRVYTINLDQFSCAIGKIIDVCHPCAGSVGKVKLDPSSGLPEGKN